MPPIPETPAAPSPLSTPNLTPDPATTKVPHQNSSGVVIMQWLTYAFWGWTVFALSALTATVLTNALNSSDTSGFTPYAIAAVVVLLPISLVCDYIYSKHEQIKKTGAAMVILVIHAVLFALLGIGSLIVAVFSAINLMTSSTGSSSTNVVLYSALIVAVYYALTFIRTIRPAKIPRVHEIYLIFMLVTVGVFILLGVIGPIANARNLRSDRLIEYNLSELSSNINGYTNDNKSLPASLSTLTTQGDTKKLVDQNLVNYTPNSKNASKLSTSVYDSTTRTYKSVITSTYFYTLCVNFKKASPNYSSYTNYSSSSVSEYTSYADAYNHPAGKVCYKISTQ